MPLYHYKAKYLDGTSKEDEMEAKDEKELAKMLRQSGFLLISASPKEKRNKKFFSLNLDFLKRVSLKEKLMLTKNLEVMIRTGVPLPRALRALSLQSKNRFFQKALEHIAQNITQGKSFSESLKFYPKIFPEIFYQMVQVGEESGTLEVSLKNLSCQIEKEHELRSKIKSALIYPAVIIAVMVCIAVLMLIMVVPKLSAVFQEMNIQLPLTTKVVLFLGDFLSHNILWLILFVIGLIFCLRIAFKTKKGRKIKDALLLKIPVIGMLVRKVNTSHFLRTLAVLTDSGVSFVRSLEITSGVVSNVYFKEALLEAEEAVKKGKKLSESLKEYQGLFSPTTLQMLTVGEETGESSKILGDLANFFEAEVETATKNLVSVIEPVLMVLIGAVVGFFAISMVQPIYSMIQAF